MEECKDIMVIDWATRIPTDAEELWIIPVITAPARIPKMGLLPSVANTVEKTGASR